MNAQPAPIDRTDLSRRRRNLAQVVRIQLARPAAQRSYLLLRECIAECRRIDAQLRAVAH